ncbi:ATP/GTP-binding protein [Arcanobacterium phocisimile]|uniref:ATP/GTP-binding protein n=1 Tax=Arcanobacterium phocisimile TaxID=1302235 RepID=A0ABX7II63_9ACTO|nr:ATP/GTP-binding protein [Arcanobacterium phocisimile]QRV02517.1 ATP/GTP-binding protein [Arcanobacterium phocisimile]
MRRSKKYSRPSRELNSYALMGYTRIEYADDGRAFKVHHINSGVKEYVCPGCSGIIRVGEPHEVAWTEDHILGKEFGQNDRRHWHTGCWEARGRRR